MRYIDLCRRVDAAEHEFEASVARTRNAWSLLKHDTRRAATPPRIVISGLLSGFMLGLAAPLSHLGGSTRIIQLASGLMTLLGSLQVREAADDAQQAAESVDEVATDASSFGTSSARSDDAFRVD